MDPLSKLIDPTKLTGNLVNNFQAALNDVSKSAVSQLTSEAKNLTGTLTSGVSALSGGLTSGITDALNGVSKLAGAVTNPAALLNKIAGNSTGVFSQVQSLLDSVGNMSGQIKTPVLATGTIDTSAITAKMGKLLGNAKISPPVFEESAAPSAANAYQEAQSEALGKISEIEAEMELLSIKKSSVNTDDPQSEQKISEFNKQLDSLNGKLTAAQRAYERTIVGA